MATVVKAGPSERPTGREQILDAVLDAADELMSSRGPDVSLRAIAEHAGISYSLVHRHLGTKEAIVDRLLQRYAERWSKTLAEDPDYGRALDRLLDAPGAGAGSYLRLLAWTILADDQAINGGRSNAKAHARHARLLPVAGLRHPDAGGAPPVETRIDLAVSLSLIFGWRFFQHFIVAALDLAELKPEVIHRALRAQLGGDADV